MTKKVSSRLSPVLLDLRSDVVSAPTPQMWDAMRHAGFRGTPLGDDPHVRELEEYSAALAGKEAALFLLTGTAANLVAMMARGARGTQIVLEQTAHIATSEGWGLASVCGLVPRLIETERSVIDPAQLQDAIETSLSRYKIQTSLVCLENSHTASGGVLLTPQATAALCAVAKNFGAWIHLDGARIFNVASALDVAPSTLMANVDSVAFNLNKGLSAPLGAILCGSQNFIDDARAHARSIGAATLHKAGALAAAGLVALENRNHLADDNRRARELALALCDSSPLEIDLETVQTNLVKTRLDRTQFSNQEFAHRLREKGVLCLPCADNVARFVLHRGVNDEDVKRVAQTVAAIL